MKFPVISPEYPLILASASPRRKDLLRQVGLPFQAIPSHAMEESGSGDPGKVSCLLAQEKACRVWEREQNSWTLGADTMVVINNKILGKPQDKNEALDMIQQLSGREHQVVTGFCILAPSGENIHSESLTTFVRIRPLTGKEISAYVQTGEPFGKAGGYAIQGIGGFMVESITGSYSNVVGLPLCALVRALVSVGALHDFPCFFDV